MLLYGLATESMGTTKSLGTTKKMISGRNLRLGGKLAGKLGGKLGEKLGGKRQPDCLSALYCRRGVIQ
jgi:hypothetical protein